MKTNKIEFLDEIKINKLKGIYKLDSLSFKPHNLTAILGPNGVGKSTILHAIAGIYQKGNLTQGENHRLIDFFPISPDSEWNGSDFEIITSSRDKFEIQNEPENRKRQTRKYGKPEKKSSRWKPRYTDRISREVYYLGIDKCVPMIESEKKGNVKYDSTPKDDDISKEILKWANQILEKNYNILNTHKSPNGKTFLGVATNNLSYSSLTMSAGEQKILLILKTIIEAGKRSMVLIDELDLLLHDKAFKKLVEVISRLSSKKEIQVIFTTHRESIIDMSHIVNVRHILSNTEGKTLCLNEAKPDTIARLTGEKITPIEIYVEDNLAKLIIAKICESLGGRRLVTIIPYGAIDNCFTILASSLIKGEELSKSLFVLDGDVGTSEEDIKKAMDRKISGLDYKANNLKIQANKFIVKFNLPNETSPEEYIHNAILKIQTTNEDEQEIISVAQEIISPKNKHDFINKIIQRIWGNENEGLPKIIDLFSKTQEWENMTSKIYQKIKTLVDKEKEFG